VVVPKSPRSAIDRPLRLCYHIAKRWTPIKDVDSYLQNLEAERRTALEALRILVMELAPGAVETMRYRMPTYEYTGTTLGAFASQKHTMSLYLDPALVARHRTQLAGPSLGKSCIRFKRLEQLPWDTIRHMLQEAVQERAS
jgi:uncharacterized protein YdhG (YjbR/CyaY superfamily)